MTKTLFKLLLLVAIPVCSFGQSLTIETCHEKAFNNYPLIKQVGLIKTAAQYNIANAQKANLPQLNLSARATYQSAVTGLPISIPNVNIPKLAKDQYQATLEANQTLWDGGATAAQKNNIKAAAESELEKLNVDLYAVNERVNQLFFSTLLIKEQIAINGILLTDLNTNYQRIEACKLNGTANQSDLDAVRVEQLNTLQRDAELKSNLKSYREMLSAMIDMEVNDNTVLERPVVHELDYRIEVKRPELSMFDAQQRFFDSQRSIIESGNKPHVGLFVLGGFGRSGLNMLTNEFSGFYQGGIRLSWNLSGLLYTQKNNLDKIEISKKQVEIQKETFLFNNELSNKQTKNDIDRIKTTLRDDNEIIRLRNNIKKASEVKVQNGTATVTDLLRDINAENASKQLKSLHEIQLYMAVYQYKNSTNN